MSTVVPVDAVVTGASGFAGTWLCRHLLAAGLVVEGWSRRGPNADAPAIGWRTVDVTDSVAVKAAMAQAGPRVVYHLAGISGATDAASDPLGASSVNIHGTGAVAAAAAAVGARLVLASSCHVYGDPARLPLTEREPLVPTGVYGLTKLAAEKAALRCGGDVVVARSFHHAGPGQGAGFAIPSWATQLARGNLPIRVGDLSLRRDYTDVRDIVSGYALLADRAEPGAILNLCSGHAVALSEILRILANGAMPPVTTDATLVRANEPRELWGSAARAESLGWRRSRPLAQTLADVRAAAEISLRGCP